MIPIVEGQLLALWYEPWTVSWDLRMKELNEADFREWYDMILVAISSMQMIPKTLLDEFSGEVSFEALHGHTYLRPECIHPETFKMRPQKFILTEAALPIEMGSWPGVACEITNGKYKYMFETLKP